LLRLVVATALGFVLAMNGGGLALAGNGDDSRASSSCTDAGNGSKDNNVVSASCQVPEVPSMLIYPAVGIAVYCLHRSRSRRYGVAVSLDQ